MEQRKGDYIQVYSGTYFWPLDPRPDEIHIGDIAHALSQQCRYSGHTIKPYSVAEHSLYVSRYVPPEHALWGLLHDASEAYLVDIPRPLKPYLPEYLVIEARLMEVIAQKFGLSAKMPAEVKEVDTRILANERQALLVEQERVWGVNEPPLPGLTIACYRPAVAERLFLQAFEHLMRKAA